MVKLANLILRRLFSFLPEHVVGLLCFETASVLGRLFDYSCVSTIDCPKYVNLGCGSRILDGFVNIDFYTCPEVNFGADLRYPLRIGDGLFEGIYCEHTFEHLNYQECRNLLKECYRILKPGGVLRVIVPDLSIFIHNYCSDNPEWFVTWERLMYLESVDAERSKRRLATPMEAISFVTQEYGHVSCWDFETLAVYLKQSGFSEIARGEFRVGVCRELLVDLDSEDRKYVSLYVDAIKPAFLC